MISENQQIDVEFEEELKCPITFQKMKEPVNIETGHTFEKKAITKWINKSLKSPLSGVKLTSKTLTENKLIQKTIQNYNNMLMLPLQMIQKYSQYSSIKHTYCLKQQINLYDRQISNILRNENAQKMLKNKHQYEQKHSEQMRQFIQRQNLYISGQIAYILNLNTQQHTVQQQRIRQKIQILGHMFMGLDQNDIQSFQMYTKLRQQEIDQIRSQTRYGVVLSQNAYKLHIQFDLNIDDLIIYSQPEVQYIEFQGLDIIIQQLKIFMQNIHTAFPNLKILSFCQCKQFGDQGWRSIIESIDNLSHIRYLRLQRNKISNVTLDELNQLNKIEGLRYFSIRNNRSLTKQSRNNLRRFKNQHFILKMYYA